MFDEAEGEVGRESGTLSGNDVMALHDETADEAVSQRTFASGIAGSLLTLEDTEFTQYHRCGTDSRNLSALGVMRYEQVAQSLMVVEVSLTAGEDKHLDIIERQFGEESVGTNINAMSAMNHGVAGDRYRRQRNIRTTEKIDGGDGFYLFEAVVQEQIIHIFNELKNEVQ